MERRIVATTLVERLRLCGWRLDKDLPSRRHSTP